MASPYPADGLMWCDVPDRRTPVVVGLVVAGGRVVDGPPYARTARRGWRCCTRPGGHDWMGEDARGLWRHLHRAGVVLRWLPALTEADAVRATVEAGPPATPELVETLRRIIHR